MVIADLFEALAGTNTSVWCHKNASWDLRGEQKCDAMVIANLFWGFWREQIQAWRHNDPFRDSGGTRCLVESAWRLQRHGRHDNNPRKNKTKLYMRSKIYPKLIPDTRRYLQPWCGVSIAGLTGGVRRFLEFHPTQLCVDEFRQNSLISQTPFSVIFISILYTPVAW